MNIEERKELIARSSIEQLLWLQRFEPVGSPWFAQPIGDILIERIRFLREQDPESYVNASKSIGW